ncbi:MAG TPA: HEAT repeat domain-containing protein, partial [Thermomonospora sp.]|nr:HEAT repeat domain-containing protein [Thermomonospora sp.]
MDGYAAKVTGGPAVFAGLLGAAPTVRDDLLDDALDGDVGALVAEALHACAAGSRDAVLLALTVVDRASIDDDCPALRPEAVRVLAGLCRPDQDVEVLVAALPLFGVYVPGPEAAQRLAAMTGHPVAEVRAAAVSGMEYFADEGSFPAAGGDFVERLARLLGGDPDAKVRLAAAEAFGMVETWVATDRGWLPTVVEALSRALDADPDPDVRAEAAENLAQMIALDDRQWAMVADTLRRHLDDADVRVAAWALARVATLGDPEALDRLWALV